MRTEINDESFDAAEFQNDSLSRTEINDEFCEDLIADFVDQDPKNANKNPKFNKNQIVPELFEK